MSDLRIVGVALQLVLALTLVGVGAAAIRGRLRPARFWDRGWGRTPQRADGVALAVLGLGIGAWALTQTVDLIAMGLQLAAIALVLVGAVGVVVVQTRIPDDGPADP